MPRKPKFNPRITRIKLNPEQAVLSCNCHRGTGILPSTHEHGGSVWADYGGCTNRSIYASHIHWGWGSGSWWWVGRAGGSSIGSS